jgi:hypothetical protein
MEKEFYLFSKSRIELGQTVELEVLPSSDSPSSYLVLGIVIPSKDLLSRRLIVP